MPSDRPYIGLSWDDMEERIDKIMADFIHELKLIDEELQHRRTPSARALHQRVRRMSDALARAA
jgi:hypothetical protein